VEDARTEGFFDISHAASSGVFAQFEAHFCRGKTQVINYLNYYHLENYLFTEVNRRFHGQGFIDAFDFMSIVIWKANRAKSKIARRLIGDSKDPNALDTEVRKLTTSISAADGPKERLKLLIDGKDAKFRLAMATAILTVLYPEDFTVYDVRVCDTFLKFKNLKDATNFENTWKGYTDYMEAVRDHLPGLSMRETDRYLWAKSAADQLTKDIQNCFPKPSKDLPEE
jgi:hypothetical protein